jgi:hypothetical protein
MSEHLGELKYIACLVADLHTLSVEQAENLIARASRVIRAMDEEEAEESEALETTRYDTLRALMVNLKTLESSLSATAEHVENTVILAECADATQAVREHFWPLWMIESRQMPPLPQHN